MHADMPAAGQAAPDDNPGNEPGDDPPMPEPQRTIHSRLARPGPARPHGARSPLAAVAAGLALAGLAAGCAQVPLGGTPTLPVVERVDPARYAGDWYEIARLPHRQQVRCLGDVTARYTPRPDGGLDVLNRCRTAEGADEARGLAYPTDATHARLKVSFLPNTLRWLPVGRGDYQIIELAPDYGWALVGEPRREYLWVLSRAPTLDRAVLDRLLARAASLGFARQQVILTDQGQAAR